MVLNILRMYTTKGTNTNAGEPNYMVAWLVASQPSRVGKNESGT